MLDLKKLLTKVLSLLRTPFRIEVYTAQYYGNGWYMDFTLPTVSGYSPLAVIGFQSGGAASAGINVLDMFINGQNLRISNNGSVSNISLTCHVLYVRNELRGGGVFNLQVLRNILTPRKVVGAC